MTGGEVGWGGARRWWIGRSLRVRLRCLKKDAVGSLILSTDMRWHLVHSLLISSRPDRNEMHRRHTQLRQKSPQQTKEK